MLLEFSVSARGVAHPLQASILLEFDIKFRIRLGNDKSNNRSIFEKIHDGQYRLGDSKIQYVPKKNKFFLLACVT